MRDAFIAGLLDLARKDKKIILLTADLGFGVLDDFRNELPNQFINVGVAEQNMIGIATGLALEGHSVFCYSIGNFPTLRCLEQIRNDAAYHNANVKIVSVGGGLSYGQLGMSHHATEDLAIMRALPGVKVVVPSTRTEAMASADYLYRELGVVYLRLDKSFAKNSDSDLAVDLSSWRVLKEGHDIWIVAAGGVLEEVITAAEILSANGVEVGVVSATNLTPISSEIVLNPIKRSKVVISVEEHVKVGGLGGLLAEAIGESDLHTKLIRLGVSPGNMTAVGSQKYLRNLNDLSAEKIVEVVLSTKVS
jgi:transketolase